MDDFEARPQEQPIEQLNDDKNRLIDVDQLFNGMNRESMYELQDRIYENYATAMRLRDREPLETESFQRHFFDGGNFQESKVFGGPKDGYLLGSEVNGVFVPTHFAPSGLRGGYRLIKDLVHAETPSALFITQDLVDTIKKMDGWKVLPFKITTDFRGSDVEKTLVVNKWSTLTKLTSHKVETVVKDKLTDTQYRIKELGNKARNLIRRDQANVGYIDEELKASLLSNDLYLEDNDERYLETNMLRRLRDTKLLSE